MKKILLVVLAVVVIVIGVIVFVSLKTGKELKPLAAAILQKLSDGQVEQVFEDAAPRFREEMGLDAFRRYVELRRKALGAFQGITKTTGAGASTSTGEGTQGKVDLELAYERGATTGEVHFQKVDGAWKLLGLQVLVPESLIPQPEPERLEAIGLELLDLFGQGELVALYERFAPELKKAWPAETYQQDMTAFRERMGDAGKPSFQGTEDAEGGYVVALFDVPFANGPGAARLKFFWRDLDWNLLGFAVNEKK